MTLGLRCTIQSVVVYDGLVANSLKRLAQLCGNIEDSKPIPSTSNTMLIVVDSFSHRFESFQGEVYFTYGPSVGCGGAVNLTETKQLVSPSNLPHMDCHWTIVAPRDYKVQLEFNEIHVSTACENPVRNHSLYCTCSYIEVRDGGGPFAEQMVRLCSSDNNLKSTLITSWNTAYVRLYSAVPQNNMFRLTLTPVESKCGKSILTITNEMQELTSPDYPMGYPENIKCTWIIKNSQQSQRLMIYFEDFDLQGHSSSQICDSDRLQISEDGLHEITNEGFGPNAIHNGQFNYFGIAQKYKFCGNDTKPFNYFSSGNEVVLNFRSLPFTGKKGRGFKLKYGTSGCNRTIHANEGNIQNDILNGNGTNCVTTIVADSGRTVSIYFMSFYFFGGYANCTNSGLEIMDGNLTGKQLLKACGFRLLNPVFSDTNVVTPKTYSTERRTFFRYNLVFTSSTSGKGCGGKLFNYMGSFSSPMYPNIYREGILCTWEVFVPRGFKVALKFKDFNIEGACSKNKVIVTTFYAAAVGTFTYCSGDSPATLFSENKLNVTYYSSVNNGGNGWMANFVAVKEENDSMAHRLLLM